MTPSSSIDVRGMSFMVSLSDGVYETRIDGRGPLQSISSNPKLSQVWKCRKFSPWRLYQRPIISFFDVRRGSRAFSMFLLAERARWSGEDAERARRVVASSLARMIDPSAGNACKIIPPLRRGEEQQTDTRSLTQALACSPTFSLMGKYLDRKILNLRTGPLFRG